jgi:hypothetical protein
MVPYVLIVVTLLSGGPVVTMQDFETKEACEAAKLLVLKMVDLSPPRAKAECVAKRG